MGKRPVGRPPLGPRVELRLPPKVLRALRRLAKRRGQPLAAVARALIEEGLGRVRNAP